MLSNDEVCGLCNTRRLKPLDDYLIRPLGIFKVILNQVGTKAGKPPKVERPGVYAVRGEDRADIFINEERRIIYSNDGVAIQPAGNHPEAVRFTTVGQQSSEGQVDFGI